MIAVIAKQHGSGPGALNIEADIVLIGHAYTAVHLDRLIGRQFGHFAELGLGYADQQRAFLVVTVQGLQSF